MKTYDEHRRPLNLQKIADLEAEVKRLNEAIELQIHVTGSAADTIDARDAEIERLKTEYSALQKRYDTLWRQIAAKDAEIERLREEKENYAEIVAGLRQTSTGGDKK